MNELDQTFWRFCDWLELNQGDLLKAGSSFSVLIPAFHFVYHRHCLLPQYRLLYVYLLTTSIVELTGVATMRSGGNMWLYNPYCLFEVGMLAALYYQFIYMPLVRVYIKWSAAICIGLGLIDYVMAPAQYSAFIYTGTAFCISTYLLLWMYETYQTRHLGIDSLLFWFTIGGFLFYPTAQIPYLQGAVFARRPEGMEDIWNTLLGLNISYHFFATGGILSLCREE